MSNTQGNSPVVAAEYSDEQLIKHFPGFSNKNITVNGVNLHYVEGGSGDPLICLPGWPQTWYSYLNIAPGLSQKYRVIVVDIRGMGSSEKPISGYDKKTMAGDVYALLQAIGLDKVNMMGHDIGGMVAMSFAYNYPQAIKKLIIADGVHPGQGMMQMPLIPAIGTFDEKMDNNYPYAWWMAFNQVKDLPEMILEDRYQYLLDWLFHYVMIDDSKISALEKAVYASHYNQRENIRASNAWYQTFTSDIEDAKMYNQLTMPVLGIGSNVSYNYMKYGMPDMARDLEVIGILDSGHYMFEEQPAKVLEAVLKFLN